MKLTNIKIIGGNWATQKAHVILTMDFERITPEKAGISTRHLINFLEALEKNGTELHSFMFLRHGKVFSEFYCKPYNKDSRHTMFSFTKALTSTAIGFAKEEGILSLSEKLVDLFPEALPEKVSDNLKECEIRHLLTMSCGHENEIPELGMGNPDWIRAFFAHPFVYKPGTHFLYNTAGTNLLCAILKKKTGLSLIEFLKPRLLDKLGLYDVPCMTLTDGTQMGGAGSRLKTEEMAKFIQFVANKGVWQGERLLSEEWFDEASAVHIKTFNINNGADWNEGYGYQFWRCQPEGAFRADGAFGQYGLILPKEDAVLIITSCSPNLQNTLDPVWKEILPYFEDKEVQEDPEATAIFNYLKKNASLKARTSERNPGAEKRYTGTTYKPNLTLCGNWADLVGGAGINSDGNFVGINKPATTSEFRSFLFEISPYEITLTATCGDEKQALHISMEGCYNSFTLSGKTYGAVGRWTGSNTLDFTVRCAESATGRDFRLVFTEKGAVMSRKSTYVEPGCLNDVDVGDIIFTRI